MVVSITTAVLPNTSHAAYMLFSAIDARDKEEQWNTTQKDIKGMASWLGRYSTCPFKKYRLAWMDTHEAVIVLPGSFLQFCPAFQVLRISI